MSIKQTLKERFGGRVQIQAVSRVPSGSSVRLRLSVLPEAKPNTPKAAVILAQRHLGMKKAHIALTRLLDEGSVVVEVPVVEDVGVLIQELTEVGLDAALHEPPETVDVKALREREGMSQEEFALWYGLDVSTLRNWEQGRSQPDRTSRTMLHMISVSPRQVRESLDRAIAAE